MLLGPGRLSFGKDHAVVAEDTRDPVHSSSDVAVEGGPDAEESPEGLVVFRWDVDRGQMSAPVEPSEHDGFMAVGRAPFARLARDETRCDDIAVEPIVGEDAL